MTPPVECIPPGLPWWIWAVLPLAGAAIVVALALLGFAIKFRIVTHRETRTVEVEKEFVERWIEPRGRQARDEADESDESSDGETDVETKPRKTRIPVGPLLFFAVAAIVILMGVLMLTEGAPVKWVGF